MEFSCALSAATIVMGKVLPKINLPKKKNESKPDNQDKIPPKAVGRQASSTAAIRKVIIILALSSSVFLHTLAVVATTTTTKTKLLKLISALGAASQFQLSGGRPVEVQGLYRTGRSLFIGVNKHSKKNTNWMCVSETTPQRLGISGERTGAKKRAGGGTETPTWR